jgi:hypothetical protein
MQKTICKINKAYHVIQNGCVIIESLSFALYGKRQAKKKFTVSGNLRYLNQSGVPLPLFYQKFVKK